MREACRAMPDPAPLSAFDNVYAQPSAIIEAERAQYAAYLNSFEGQEAGR
jgi:pyruvate dehydrogenase E1 component alpha subunit